LERLAEPGRFPSGVVGFFGPDAEGGPLGSLSGLGCGGRFGASGNPFSRRISSWSCSMTRSSASTSGVCCSAGISIPQTVRVLGFPAMPIEKHDDRIS
jgi:hypothetical protein